MYKLVNLIDKQVSGEYGHWYSVYWYDWR